MSLPRTSGPAPAGAGRTPRGETLHVSADLRVGVTAPDGRSAHLVLRDDGGTLRVVLGSLADLRVVGASLPGGLGGVGGPGGPAGPRGPAARAAVDPGRRGRGRPVGAAAPPGRPLVADLRRLAGPVAAGAAGALVVLGAVGLLVAAAARRRRG